MQTNITSYVGYWSTAPNNYQLSHHLTSPHHQIEINPINIRISIIGNGYNVKTEMQIHTRRRLVKSAFQKDDKKYIEFVAFPFSVWMSISLKMFFIYNVLCCVSFTFLCSILYLVKVKLIKDLCAQLRAGVRDKFLSTIEFSYK